MSQTSPVGLLLLQKKIGWCLNIGKKDRQDNKTHHEFDDGYKHSNILQNLQHLCRSCTYVFPATLIVTIAGKKAGHAQNIKKTWLLNTNTYPHTSWRAVMASARDSAMDRLKAGRPWSKASTKPSNRGTISPSWPVRTRSPASIHCLCTGNEGSLHEIVCKL